jgi:hypothetical protein
VVERHTDGGLADRRATKHVADGRDQTDRRYARPGVLGGGVRTLGREAGQERVAVVDLPERCLDPVIS